MGHLPLAQLFDCFMRLRVWFRAILVAGLLLLGLMSLIHDDKFVGTYLGWPIILLCLAWFTVAEYGRVYGKR